MGRAHVCAGGRERPREIESANHVAVGPRVRRRLLPRPLLHAQAASVLDHSRTPPQGDGRARPALAGAVEGGECNLIILDASDVLHDAFAVRGLGIDAEGEVSSKRRGHLRLLLPDLLRTSRNSLGPLRSRRLRRCRSSSVADGSLRRSISWPAIARAFSALPVPPARWALGPCSVAMTD